MASGPRELSTLSLHDALPIFSGGRVRAESLLQGAADHRGGGPGPLLAGRQEKLCRILCVDAAGCARAHRAAATRTLSWRTRYDRSEEHTSELQSRENLVCRLL